VTDGRLEAMATAVFGRVSRSLRWPILSPWHNKGHNGQSPLPTASGLLVAYFSPITVPGVVGALGVTGVTGALSVTGAPMHPFISFQTNGFFCVSDNRM